MYMIHFRVILSQILKKDNMGDPVFASFYVKYWNKWYIIGKQEHKSL